MVCGSDLEDVFESADEDFDWMEQVSAQTICNQISKVMLLLCNYIITE